MTSDVDYIYLCKASLFLMNGVRHTDDYKCSVNAHAECVKIFFLLTVIYEMNFFFGSPLPTNPVLFIFFQCILKECFVKGLRNQGENIVLIMLNYKACQN